MALDQLEDSILTPRHVPGEYFYVNNKAFSVAGAQPGLTRKAIMWGKLMPGAIVTCPMMPVLEKLLLLVSIFSLSVLKSYKQDIEIKNIFV